MKVLVVGGSGFVGTNLCRELKERGHEVTALSRSPSSDELPKGVNKTMGNVTVYDSIKDAFEGMDAVYNLVALSPLFKPSGGNEMHDKVHRHGTENVVRAAEKHEVDRFVQMSALGADPDGPTAYIRAKGEAEQIVTESVLDWTIFRPSVIFGDGGEFVSFTKLLAPPYVSALPGGGKTRFQPLYVDDVVGMMADAIEDDAHIGERYEIGGPDKLTLAEIAKMIHKSNGRSTTIVPIPMGLAKVGLTIGGAIPGVPMGTDQYRSLKFDNVTDDNDIEAFGYGTGELTTLRAYLNNSHIRDK
ncbi:nucleoside-diphosphate sugar epimerase [Halogeometricum borinquense DSM 11551]|uniref:Nucleoside-diphosphate sugar epimerase n=2 Tax=Halogeometricum borinquense TaxID=60847 RepID=E4NN13_HALBP|nr:complex I NDUFA9 subunit family protein [Halogeometricum borinquense]ADQ66243.1 predicted nucleoside-diphosphate sugar epimerase [Halogeometricum borinquense DSM 11551]ELY27261.1 nucleoside-diphosphate sugar epimerase [Halogeometricum borinquense DSM 11551]RYJ14729.1 complex I NDUFA9 subunit family protein [Halogeometricum borinquense]